MAKTNTKFSATLKKLIFLVSIFLTGIFILIFVHLFFLDLIEKLDSKTKNLEAKIEIGDYIVNDLYKVRSDFYELTTSATNKRGREIVKKRLEDRIKLIKKSLYILENGGELTRKIRLNIIGQHNTTKKVTYIRDNNSLPLEVIDISPKLKELGNMVSKLLVLLEEQEVLLKQKKIEEYVQLNKKIKRFYKRSPAYFIRITENTNRLLFEGTQELLNLQTLIKEEKRQYAELEIIIILSIILLVFILSYFTARQINANAKKLEHQEASTRGVLDGQPNIVVVSNGKEMVDANIALVDFFEEYDDFSEFSDKHLCICDFFVDIGDDQFVIDKDYNGKRWHEYIIENPQLVHKAAMYDKNENLVYFTVTAKKTDLDKNNFLLVISLNDISKEIKTQKELKELNDNLEDIVNEKTKELKILNETLEHRIEEELVKNRQKDKKMIQQSRFAALGEMIGNIAHQWRQPLSAISSTASSMQLQLQLGIEKKEDINKSYENIGSYVKFLSQTIEDFRLFFKEDKENVKFDMLNILKNTMTITDAAYKDLDIHININTNKESLLSLGLANELSQVYLNILNNAKDALKNSKNDHKEVTITTYSNEKYNIIEITDNAGGVPHDIINKIFDPYFTTKHQAQGTGIGLYMSKEIIEKHMSGILQVENKEITIKDKIYLGACFTLSLPKL